MKQLLSDKDKYSTVKATVRSKKTASALLSAGLTDEDVIEFDLAAAAAAAAEGEAASAAEGAEANTARLTEALKGADVLVICTSAVPQIKYTSLIGVIAGRLVGRKNMPGFTWKQGQTPEKVRSCNRTKKKMHSMTTPAAAAAAVVVADHFLSCQHLQDWLDARAPCYLHATWAHTTYGVLSMPSQHRSI